jgi:hypothetical protein
MNDFQVNCELSAVITDDQDSDATAAGFESFDEAGPEVGLVDDREGLLDIASLSHCNNSSILKVKNTVLLEDRA